jgi:hypothetical protein
MIIGTRRLLSGSLVIAAIAPLALLACGGNDNNQTPAPAGAPATTAHPGTTRAPGTTEPVATTEVPTTATVASTTSSASTTTSSSSTSSSSTTSTTAGATGITIQSFSVTPSPIPCNAEGQGVATMAWTVVPSNVAVTFLVDGAGSGPAQIASMTNAALPSNFKCDGQPHRITIVASNASGTVQRDALVTTAPSTTTTHS